MESLYWGYVLQNNHPQQMVYAQADGSRGLTIESKLFQPDEPVTYSLLDSTGLPSADFAVDDDGLVINLHTIDYENPPAPLAQLEVRAVQAVGTVQLTSIASVFIRIGNIDIGPQFETPQYVTTVPEDTPVTTQILEVKARDYTNANAEISYSLNDAGNFSIVTEYRNGFYVGIISIEERLDYDRIPTHYYEFVVVAAVNGQPTSRTNSASVRVYVTNVNDEAPEFVHMPGKIFNISVNLQPGSVVTQFLAFDRDGDGVSYNFTGW
ncbi:neural-cadherin-like [Pomacea canaliculata]|uniref:neural-cadherin-like n=1 Tax=Pomacea canaliculata TaxID=400727 RepID=UPI000D7336B5|nr:neural-cadherin-like [Pomacea canaliculata]